MEFEENLSCNSPFAGYLQVSCMCFHFWCLSFRISGGFHLVCSAYFYSACYFISPQYPLSPASLASNKSHTLHGGPTTFAALTVALTHGTHTRHSHGTRCAAVNPIKWPTNLIYLLFFPAIPQIDATNANGTSSTGKRRVRRRGLCIRRLQQSNEGNV